jgi:hypothetical protein
MNFKLGGIQLSNITRCHANASFTYAANSGGGLSTHTESGHQCPTHNFTGLLNAIRFYPNVGTISGRFTLLGLV